jgi:Transposase zinc-ribbon domain
MDAFSAPYFRNDEAARKSLEAILWPDGPVCAHCGVVGHAYATKRLGVYRCAEKECRKERDDADGFCWTGASRALSLLQNLAGVDQ